MKIRLGFVSNSSSSSFTVCKRMLGTTQEQLLRNYFKVYEAVYGYPITDGDMWHMDEDDLQFTFRTGMDNVDLESFFRALGIPSEAITEGPY